MNRLPQKVVELTDTLMLAARYELAGPTSALRRRLVEKDYDHLFVQFRDIIGGLLRDAELITADSELKYLGRQISGIDVLFAETGPSDTFRRFVLVEDKLLRNPEARRTVLAQILDYAHKVQYELSADQLTDALDDELQEWVADNRDEIESSLRTGDCLLLICGDEIHERVATLAERFAKQANPLSRCEIALIAMNLYSDGMRHLLIPTVIGAAVRFSRDLTIEVTVVDRDGQPVTAKSQLVERSPDRGRAAVGEDEFFRTVWARFSSADVSACRKTLQQLERSGVPGLRKEVRRDGRPVLIVQDTRWGTVTVLWVARTLPVIRDSLEINPSLKKDEDALRSWTEFRRALIKIGGAEQTNGRVFIPVRDLTEDRCEALVGALKNLTSSLHGEARPQ